MSSSADWADAYERVARSYAMLARAITNNIMTMPGSDLPFAIGRPSADATFDSGKAWEEHLERQRKATEKSIRLLKSWLNPAQLEQYESNGSFDVRGSDGGHYRIGPPSPFNIRVIEPEGHCGSAYCVVPKDISAPGDIQLAQKIALENDEEATIRAANRAQNAGYAGSFWVLPTATD